MEHVKGWLVPVAAISAIAVLELKWIEAGHNGIFFSVALVAIAGIAGYKLQLFRRS